MRNTVFFFLGMIVAFCLGFSFRAMIPLQSQTNAVAESKKVTGVGGIFFKSSDSKKLKEWYKVHLGLNTDAYGARFEWQEGADPKRKGSLQWSTFAETTKYFEPSTKDFMINYTVENLAGLVEQLKKEDVTIVDQLETYEYGSFIHIMDIDGNKIELYEPNYNHEMGKGK